MFYKMKKSQLNDSQDEKKHSNKRLTGGEVRCKCTENRPFPPVPTSEATTSCNSRSIMTISSMERVLQIYGMNIIM